MASFEINGSWVRTLYDKILFNAEIKDDVRYQRHHWYDGSRMAGKPEGPLLRGIVFDYANHWGDRSRALYLEDGEVASFLHVTEVRDFQPELLDNDWSVRIPCYIGFPQGVPSHVTVYCATHTEEWHAENKRLQEQRLRERQLVS